MKSTLLLLATFCTFTALTFAQERPKRQATVITVDDKKYEGVFIKADEMGVTIETEDVQTTIKLDTVKLIMFGSVASSPTPSPTPDPAKLKEVEAAQRAVKALRRLANASQVGVSYVNYTPMVVEAKTEVEDALLSIKNGALKEALSSAIFEYRYAAGVWQKTWRDTNIYDKDLKRTAVSDYRVKTHGLLKVVWRDEFLGAIWGRARWHLERAAQMTESQQ